MSVLLVQFSTTYGHYALRSTLERLQHDGLWKEHLCDNQSVVEECLVQTLFGQVCMKKVQDVVQRHQGQLLKIC